MFISMIAIVTGVFAVLTAIVLYAIANLMDRFEEKTGSTLTQRRLRIKNRNF